MNEQLQKELLDILRSLKDGASPAWQVLVEQRSAYAWASLHVGGTVHSVRRVSKVGSKVLLP